ncbi:sensor histidine kinase [Shewanella gelidii]|uniref:sensor histidine kinase n=1 Tax=Shewanella gelidii TaxID=1642821 RepID=UPI0016635AB8|nr:ATP-binding protein [Shewanella gelidii]MCL1097587.1 ATP-binding protein [Shewanella gelidii]
MAFTFTPRIRTADQVALLRSLGLIFKLLLTFFAADTFGLTLQQVPLNWALVLEAIFLAMTFKLRLPLLKQENALFIALLLDTLFWITWLYFSGGATNAFISMLLLPIALAAVMLPMWAPWVLSGLSVCAYSAMIFAVPDHHMQMHGMDMSSHYQGMWFNFVISALVMTSSVALIAKRVRKQDQELAKIREGQLRQEQLLALGTASAQMAHQLATPMFSMRLLIDELQDEAAQPQELVEEMDGALKRCEDALGELRLATDVIRSGHQQTLPVLELVSSFKQKLDLFMPQTEVDYEMKLADDHLKVQSDTSLLPALLALAENAARASQEHIGQPRVSFSVERNKQSLLIRIRDYGAGIDNELLNQLGHHLVQNPKGLGVSLMLSHASLERIGGRLMLSHHQSGGSVATVTLPLSKDLQ